MPKTVKILADDVTLDVEKRIYRHIGVIRDMVTVLPKVSKDDCDNVIPLYNVSVNTLMNIVNVLKTFDESVPSKYTKTLVHSFSQEQIKSIANAINFLQIDCLVEVVYGRIIEWIEVMDQEEVSAFLA